MQGGDRRRASVARKSRKRSDARLWPSPLTCQNLRVIAREVERWDRDVSSLRVGRSGLQQTRARLRPVLFFQIRADIAAAVEQAPQAARRDQEPTSGLAAITAAQLHRRADRGGRDLVQRCGERNRSIGLTWRLRRQELVRAQLAGRRQEQSPFQGIFQLPDVPGPGMGAQLAVHFGCQRRHRQTVLPGESLEHRLSDAAEIVAPLPQGRQPEHDAAQAEVEILPESRLAHALSEMLVGRRQNAYVDRPRFRPSDPADLLVLQYTQQLGLQAERQVADLVEEQRAAVRHLEQPGLGGMGVRKGAALVTEQLGLDEVLGECRTVHGDERGAATRAAFVDRPCEEFLPGPCLADDQGARVAVWQESGRPGQILLDGLALAHDGGERVRVTVRPPYGPRPGGVDRGGDRVPEYLEIVREGEVVARTVGHELHGGAPPGIRAHDQHRHTRGNRVTLEPLDRLALGASGRDDDGSHLGRRRDGFGGADEVDRRAQVQGEVIPESLERLRQGDHAQSRHGNTSSATQLPPRPFARYSARSAAAMSPASEEPLAARERSAKPPLTVTLIGASDAPTLSHIRSATSRAARASVSGRMTANSSPP